MMLPEVRIGDRRRRGNARGAAGSLITGSARPAGFFGGLACAASATSTCTLVTPSTFSNACRIVREDRIVARREEQREPDLARGRRRHVAKRVALDDVAPGSRMANARQRLDRCAAED